MKYYKHRDYYRRFYEYNTALVASRYERARRRRKRFREKAAGIAGGAPLASRHKDTAASRRESSSFSGADRATPLVLLFRMSMAFWMISI